ncbi:MAG TPA: class I SAM-dependent methyltransferase [Caulobacteraceae bacterium]|jgi:SAM-dependent methyltransferase
MSGGDVPSPVDFHDPAQARAWVRETLTRKPWRPRFFQVFADALNAQFKGPFEAAELGSGPGQLAREILTNCPLSAYHAVDFSPAMHEIARETLGDAAAKVRFLIRDFRQPDWTEGLSVDAVVTLQAAHEVRHRDHLPALFRSIRSILRPGGLLLYCDTHNDAGDPARTALFLTRREQDAALTSAGFGRTRLLLDENEMALWAAEPN